MILCINDGSLDRQQLELPSYDGHELSLESMHSLSAVLTCGTVFLSQLETLTIIQHSDEHSSHICSLLCFFLVTVSVHSIDFVMHNRPLYCCRTGHNNILLLYCILYCVVILVRMLISGAGANLFVMSEALGCAAQVAGVLSVTFM